MVLENYTTAGAVSNDSKSIKTKFYRPSFHAPRRQAALSAWKQQVSIHLRSNILLLYFFLSNGGEIILSSVFPGLPSFSAIKKSGQFETFKKSIFFFHSFFVLNSSLKS